MGLLAMELRVYGGDEMVNGKGKGFGTWVAILAIMGTFVYGLVVGILRTRRTGEFSNLLYCVIPIGIFLGMLLYGAFLRWGNESD